MTAFFFVAAKGAGSFASFQNISARKVVEVVIFFDKSWFLQQRVHVTAKFDILQFRKLEKDCYREISFIWP